MAHHFGTGTDHRSLSVLGRPLPCKTETQHHALLRSNPGRRTPGEPRYLRIRGGAHPVPMSHPRREPPVPPRR